MRKVITKVILGRPLKNEKFLGLPFREIKINRETLQKDALTAHVLPCCKGEHETIRLTKCTNEI